MDLIRDIIVTEELLGECYQNGLFDTSVIDFIRVSKKSHWNIPDIPVFEMPRF